MDLLFKPDDLAVQAHFYRVTRALFALAELTSADPLFTGPEFDFEKILKDLMNKVLDCILFVVLHSGISFARRKLKRLHRTKKEITTKLGLLIKSSLL